MLDFDIKKQMVISRGRVDHVLHANMLRYAFLCDKHLQQGKVLLDRIAYIDMDNEEFRYRTRYHRKLKPGGNYVFAEKEDRAMNQSFLASVETLQGKLFRREKYPLWIYNGYWYSVRGMNPFQKLVLDKNGIENYVPVMYNDILNKYEPVVTSVGFIRPKSKGEMYYILGHFKLDGIISDEDFNRMAELAQRIEKDMRFWVGKTVRIKGGVFEGWSGVIVELKGDRAMVEIAAMGRTLDVGVLFSLLE
jgi:transcription antitermination factor NusG